MLHAETPQPIWDTLFRFDLLPLLFDVPGGIIAHMHLPLTPRLTIAVEYLMLADGILESPIHLFEAAVLICFQVVRDPDGVTEVIERFTGAYIVVLGDRVHLGKRLIGNDKESGHLIDRLNASMHEVHAELSIEVSSVKAVDYFVPAG